MKGLADLELRVTEMLSILSTSPSHLLPVPHLIAAGREEQGESRIDFVTDCFLERLDVLLGTLINLHVGRTLEPRDNVCGGREGRGTQLGCKPDSILSQTSPSKLFPQLNSPTTFFRLPQQPPPTLPSSHHHYHHFPHHSRTVLPRRVSSPPFVCYPAHEELRDFTFEYKG